MPALYALLLFSQRRVLVEGRRTALSAALGFLHEEFRPQLFWWELVMISQKLVQHGQNGRNDRLGRPRRPEAGYQGGLSEHRMARPCSAQLFSETLSVIPPPGCPV